MPSRKAFLVSEVQLDDRKVDGREHSSFLLQSFSPYGTGRLTFFPWFPTPQVLRCWKCSLLSCKNLEPCDLKMHFQSVVKWRVHWMLPGYNDCLHLRITKYLGYSLFNPHRVEGTIFATYCWFSSPTLQSRSLHGLKGKSCFLPPSRKSMMSELYIS